MLARSFRDVPEGSFYFFAGVILYSAFQWIFFRPMRTYVFGHELTHAIAAWVSGGQVKKFHVSKGGGSVSVTKTNIWVALAPYIFPLYSALLLVTFLGVRHFFVLESYRPAILMLFGASIGFHVALTYFALLQDQPDLKYAGTFLSSLVIFLGNMFFLTLFLAVLFPRTVSLPKVALTTGKETLIAVKGVQRAGQLFWIEAKRRINEFTSRN